MRLAIDELCHCYVEVLNCRSRKRRAGDLPRYPSLFQINTRVWLKRFSRKSGKRVTLADIEDATFDRFADRGFDWIWLLSVWQTGAAGRAVTLKALS